MERLYLLKSCPLHLLPSVWDQRCIWAACTVAFFAGLRSSEYLSADGARCLVRSDLYIAPDDCTMLLGITKTSQQGPPNHVLWPETGTETCLVRGVAQYSAARDVVFSVTAPLFLMQDCFALTLPVLNAWLFTALGPGLSRHNIRIGLATSACEAGVPDETIQRLDRWTRGACQGYIRSQRSAIGRALRRIAQLAASL